MVLGKVTRIRHGARIYRRVGATNTFRLETTFTSVSGAKRFCQLQPVGTAVRYEWMMEKLATDKQPRLYE